MTDKDTKPWALITGASSGIGLEFARLCAMRGYNLVLVSKDGEKLERTGAELGKTVRVQTIAKDLVSPASAQEIYDALAARGIVIEMLINNAGFGDFGMFSESQWDKQERMIALNVLTVAHLTHLFLPAMVRSKHGTIVNVASTAAFMPGPMMSVYYATKAFVLSFSEAIANELAGTGVTVTALCPGPTASGFQRASALEESKLVKGRRLPSARSVAEFGFTALTRGKRVAIPGLMNYLQANLARFLPRRWMTSIVRRAQDRAR